MENDLLKKRTHMDNSTIDDELNSEKIGEVENSQRSDRLALECSANVIEIILVDLKSGSIHATDKLNLAIGLLNLNLSSCRQTIQRLVDTFVGPIIQLILQKAVTFETGKILLMFVNRITKKVPPKPSLCTVDLATFTVGLLDYLNSLTEESSTLESAADFSVLVQCLQNERILSGCQDEQVLFYLTAFVNIVNEIPHFQFQHKAFEQSVYVLSFETIGRLIVSYNSSLRHLIQAEFGSDVFKEESHDDELKTLLTTIKQSLYILAKLFEGPFLQRATQVVVLSNLQSMIYGLFSLLSIDQGLVDCLASGSCERADSKVLEKYLKCNYLGYSALINAAGSLSELESFSPEFSIFLLEVCFSELQKHLQMDSTLQATPKVQSHNKATSEKILKILILVKETMEFRRSELASSFARTIDLDEMANIFDFLIKEPGFYSNDIIVESSDILITAINLAKKRAPVLELGQLIARVT